MESRVDFKLRGQPLRSLSILSQNRLHLVEPDGPSRGYINDNVLLHTELCKLNNVWNYIELSQNEQ